MIEIGRRARDLGLLDALDGLQRDVVAVEVWRVTRAGRDPTLGSPSRSRWCDGSFNALYTSFERDGALAEIHSLLSLQPVFPSKDRWFAHRLRVKARQCLRLADLPHLAKLGVHTENYKSRRYDRTQEIAEAAAFLGFDGLIAPSARWTCLNLILFSDRVPPDGIEIVDAPPTPVVWEEWRRTAKP